MRDDEIRDEMKIHAFRLPTHSRCSLSVLKTAAVLIIDSAPMIPIIWMIWVAASGCCHRRVALNRVRINVVAARHQDRSLVDVVQSGAEIVQEMEC